MKLEYCPKQSQCIYNDKAASFIAKVIRDGGI